MSNERIALERIPAPRDTGLLEPGYPKTAGYGDIYPYGSGDDDNGSQIDLAGWWRAVMRRKWFVVAIVALTTLVVTVQMYRIRPTYQALVVIEIGKENTSLVKYGDLIIQNDDTLKTKTFLLQSTPVLEDVVVSLKLDRDGTYLSDYNQLKGDFNARSVGEAIECITQRLRGHSLERQPTNVLIDTNLTIPENRPRTLAESERLDAYVSMLKKTLTVEPIPDTRLLKVSYTHVDPKLAAEVCNAVARCFINNNFEGKTERFSKASEWLDRTTRELKGKATQAEEKLASYARDHSLISTGVGASDRTAAIDQHGSIVAGPPQTLTSEKLNRLLSEVTRSETDRIVKESLYEEVKQGRISQLPEVFGDPKMLELQKRLGELTTTEAQLRVNYGPENPQVVELHQQMAAIQSQIEVCRKLLAEKVKADYQRAVRDEQAFKTAFQAARSEVVRENQDSVQFGMLQQEVETAKSLYKDFLSKTSQVDFEMAQQQNNIRLIESPRIPKVTVGPARVTWIGLALFGSVAIGVGLVIALENLDKSIKSVGDLTRIVQLPALGVIPVMESRRRRGLRRANSRKRTTIGITAAATVDDDPGKTKIESLTALDGNPIAAEAYRVLRTSVMLTNDCGSMKTILVTSSSPGEGKTTTAINTAIAIAQLGASVLIVDGDLRTSSIQRVLGADYAVGLSTCLAGDTPLDDVIRKLAIPNLSLLPCGPLPRNPAELIGSKTMRDVLKILSDRYDYIVIDSPPLIGLADPLILSTLVDGVVLVVGARKATRDAARSASDELSRVGAKILGVVLNRAHPRQGLYTAY